jgi:diguanylate cyclase
MLNVSWDPVLIAISYLVAFIASFVALDSAGKIPLSSRNAAMFWRIAGGVTLGIGIWSMHFIGMLSMKMPLMISYHLWLTLASSGIAVMTATLAINIAVTGPSLSPVRLIFATLILSAGVVSMHYVGMSAMMLGRHITWDLHIVGLSVAIAVIASGAALWMAFHLRVKRKGIFFTRLLAALVMGGGDKRDALYRDECRSHPRHRACSACRYQRTGVIHLGFSHDTLSAGNDVDYFSY